MGTGCDSDTDTDTDMTRMPIRLRPTRPALCPPLTPPRPTPAPPMDPSGHRHPSLSARPPWPGLSTSRAIPLCEAGVGVGVGGLGPVPPPRKLSSQAFPAWPAFLVYLTPRPTPGPSVKKHPLTAGPMGCSRLALPWLQVGSAPVRGTASAGQQCGSAGGPSGAVFTCSLHRGSWGRKPVPSAPPASSSSSVETQHGYG